MWLIEVEDRAVYWRTTSRDLARVVARLNGDDLPTATFSNLRQAPRCATGADERLPRLGPRRLFESFEKCHMTWSR
jgi:hypothetical protein